MRDHSRALPVVSTDPADIMSEEVVSRRRFVGVAGLTLASLSAQACAKPPRQDIVPYVERPPEVTPGVAQFYATSTTRGGYALGLLVESHEGRPTKIEGHPEHPASRGGTGAREQASILTLYDPDRAKSVKRAGERRSWEDFALSLDRMSTNRWIDRRGEGLCLVLEPSASPLREHLLEKLREKFHAISVHYHAPCLPTQRWEGARRALGQTLDVQYRFDRADVVLALDSNFLTEEPMSCRFARDFMERRKPSMPAADMNRLYVVESSLTATGACADHRLAVPMSETGAIAAALLCELTRLRGSDHADAVRARAGHTLEKSAHRAWIEALARDLSRNFGRALIVVGEREPASVHVLGHALNALLGAADRTLSFSVSALAEPGSAAYGLEPLIRKLDAGAVETLLILGPNPAYDVPEALWKAPVRKASERVHLSLYENETSADSTWFVPAAHYLEHWGDGRAYDGTLSFVQPLIEPLYGSHSVNEVLAALAGEARPSGRRLLEQYWVGHMGSSPRALAEAIRRGLLPDTSFAPLRAPGLVWDGVLQALAEVAPQVAELQVEFAPDPRLGFGELANNAWLQELPDAITQTAWGNAALVAEGLAQRFDLATGDVVALRRGKQHVELPIFVKPGQAENSITLWLGHGRSGSESVARGVGVNVTALRSSAAAWWLPGIQLEKTGRHQPLVLAQLADRVHDRPIALRTTLSRWRKEPAFTEELNSAPPSILPERLHGAPQWGMAIDLSACTGCSACVIACQAENNVPVVGKDNVALGRVMHWLRIDRYFEGSTIAPSVSFQPMLCQHCEKAPCEYVCPVNATVHSPDGLNEMVYNRCVGTRFCSNNCPYKVRRFNFFNYNQTLAETVKMQKNPDVTVRGRGVMEKCTYCVQRIRRAEIEARVARRPIAEGEVRTACQQVCPTGAIVFGLVSSPGSAVSRLQRSPRTYAALNDVGTRPRTRYLARIMNPNPELST